MRRMAGDRALLRFACLSLLGACVDGRTVVGLPPCYAPTLRDSGFLTTTEWTASDGVTLAPGDARFDTAAICGHGGVVQTLPTPRVACAVPLALDLDLTLARFDRLSAAIGVNGGWVNRVFPLGTSKPKVCLGPGAYGGAATLFLGAGNNPAACPPPEGEGGPALSFHSVSLDVDTTGVCPPPGTIPNGDFEAGAARWTFAPRDGLAEVAPGRGENGSWGAHLATDHLCERPSISGSISLPSGAVVPNLALRIWSRGTEHATASVRIGSLAPAFYTGATPIAGTGRDEVRNVCVPRWAQGTVQPLELSVLETHFAERCEIADVRDFALDGLAFVSEPACAASANVFDPGFEQIAGDAPAAPFWTLERYEDEPGSGVELKVDATLAHGGRVSARFSASGPCPRAGLSGGVTVPAPSGRAGPALAFWYEAGAGGHIGLAVSLAALTAPVSLPRAPTWTRVVACLDPRLAGRPDLLRFGIASTTGGGVCTDTFPAEGFAIDDVELATDPRCPAS
jgi:hypothetical protein